MATATYEDVRRGARQLTRFDQLRLLEELAAEILSQQAALMAALDHLEDVTAAAHQEQQKVSAELHRLEQLAAEGTRQLEALNTTLTQLETITAALEQQQRMTEVEAFLAQVDDLAARISAKWQGDIGAVEAVREGRRA